MNPNPSNLTGPKQYINADPWQDLTKLTPARIALGRAGGSLPTQHWLDFGASHAAAQDAVHATLNLDELGKQIKGVLPSQMVMTDHRLAILPVLKLQSQANDRSTYLRRPDLGRKLEPKSHTRLQSIQTPLKNKFIHTSSEDSPNESKEESPIQTLSIIVSDGLSANATQKHAAPLLASLLPLLEQLAASSNQKLNLKLFPICLVPYARVGIQDAIGQSFNADASLILLGERPGLSAPDSLGAYLVYQPQVGKTDADRNCVSNIRTEGLAPKQAARLLAYLIEQMFKRKVSGVELKDERPNGLMDSSTLNKLNNSPSN